MRTVVACGVAALLGGVVYLNALRNPFVYDDYHTVVENGSIAHVMDVRAIVFGALTRPIVNFSYAVDRAMWGTTPLGFHVTNVLLHLLNVILLFQLARRLGMDELGAFAAAGLFAVHPMMTEAVGYISGRSEVLCATFFLSALMCGRRWINAVGAKWAVRTVALWGAALATKESAAMFPFVFLAYDWLAVPEGATGRRRRILTIHLPLIATAVLAGIVRLMIFARVEYPGHATPHWTYVLLDLDVIRRYIWLILKPAGQTIFHEVAAVGLFDRRVLIGVGAVGLMTALAWRLRRVKWVASFGIVWFFLVLVPSSTLTVLDQGEPMAEHRVYLASCGLFLAAGAAISWLGAWMSRASGPVNDGSADYGPAKAGHYVRGGRFVRVVGAVALALVLVSFGAETMLRNAVWGDPVALWQESADLAPAHFRPRLLLGEALQDAGRRDEAIEQYETAIRLRPTDPTGYVKVGECLAEVGRWTEARARFLQAIDIDPRNRAAWNSLTVLNDVESRFGIDGSRR